MSVFIAIYYFNFQYSVFCHLKLSDTWPTILNKAAAIYGEIFSPSVIPHWYIDTLIYGIMLMVSQIFEFVSRSYVYFFLFHQVICFIMCDLSKWSHFLQRKLPEKKHDESMFALHIKYQIVKKESEKNLHLFLCSAKGNKHYFLIYLALCSCLISVKY